MEYQECKMGRTFVMRLSDGESIYDEVQGLAEKESVRCASVLAIGGIRKGGVVTGPEDPSSLQNIVAHVERFDDAREMVGVGTIFECEGKPLLHFHAGMGRGDGALVGCPRIEATCFLILEVVVMEWIGLDAERVADPETGFQLLKLGRI